MMRNRPGWWELYGYGRHAAPLLSGMDKLLLEHIFRVASVDAHVETHTQQRCG
jgi:hypothetical protein